MTWRESDPLAALRVRLAALVASWRARQAIAFPEYEGTGQGRCADELAAVLHDDDQEPRRDRRGSSGGFGTAETDREG
jgi:hypothetical protein